METFNLIIFLFIVSLFAWRLFCNRLPTKNNLVRCNIIYTGDNNCVGRCRLLETADHLLFSCEPFSNVWSVVLQWLHLSFIAPSGSRNHFYQFGHMVGLLRSSHTFFRIIWLACVWIIWKERNNRVFHQKVADSLYLAERVKLLSFQWLKANMITFVFSYHEWWRHPLSCMSINL